MQDSIRLRLYFTDPETGSLLLSKYCATCTKAANAFRFGVSTYGTDDAKELDSVISNNRKGAWQFIQNSAVKTVSFINGYYVEFNLKGDAELRLSNGGLDRKSDLPVILERFTVEKSATGSLVQWQTASEINLHHFDIEVAEGNKAFAQEHFKKIGEVGSKGRSAGMQAYTFLDNASDKTGTRYCRIKCVDAFGNYTYSSAVPVFFSEELTWKVYPNPTKGKFTLLYQ